MSRKKKKAGPTKAVQPTAEPLFPTGARVRVKPGTRDPDYPDMPLGGWAGTVVESETVERAVVYLVAWNDYTLQHMHPVYRNRCERDGLEMTSSWLGAEDLEADPGDAPQMEQPTNIRARPLNPTFQDDRILAIFHRTTDDPLPPVNDESLRSYYEYLAANVTLPITVDYVDLEMGLPLAKDPLTIVELLPPKEGETDGLFCATLRGEERVELPLSHLEPVRDDRTRQLLADYAYWYWNSAGENDAGPPRDEPPEEAAAAGRRTVFNAISRCGLYGAALGAAIGAVTTTMDNVLFAMGLGAITMAVVGYVAGSRYGFFFGKVNRINSGPILGGIFGIIGGAILGVVAGPLVIAYPGTIFGSILGAVLGQILRLINKRLPGPLVVGVIGTLLGAIILAWTINEEETLRGLLYGTAGGAAAGLLLSAGFFGALLLLEIKREETP